MGHGARLGTQWRPFMVRQLIAAVMIAALPVGGTSFAQEADAPERLALEGVAAIVNDQPISYSDVRQRARLLLLSLGGQQPTQEQIQQITGQALEQLIDERLQLEKAAEFEMEISPDEISGAVDDMARQSGDRRSIERATSRSRCKSGQLGRA